MPDVINSPALYDEVAVRLRDMIFGHKLPPGTRIDEVGLAKMFGVSRTPMREALKALQREGLIDLIPRKGCFVAQLQKADIDQIFAILALLEGEAAAEAALAVKPAQLRKLEQLHSQMLTRAKTGARQRYSEANAGFHELVQIVSGNDWRRRMVGDLRQVLRLSSHTSLNRIGRIEQSIAEHSDLMDAFRRKNDVLARATMRRHVENQRIAILELSQIITPTMAGATP